MTTENKISLQIAVPVPLRQCFDYLPPESGEWRHLKPGMRVKVPFQHREMVGIFMGFSTNPSVPVEKLKSVIEVLDHELVIEDDIMKLCLWAADGLYSEENYVKKFYPKTINGQHWSAIQLTTATELCTVVDLVVKQAGKYKGLVKQEQFTLQDITSNRFGQYYA